MMGKPPVTTSEPRIFLLSPANLGGERAALLISPRAAFPLAARVRSREGAPLGEVMSFMSGLYFRGKLAYARAFARPPRRAEGTLVITAGAGLRPADEPVTLDLVRRIADVEVDSANPAYREPLEASARSLAACIGGGCEVVLLGSIASNKYTDVLSRT